MRAFRSHFGLTLVSGLCVVAVAAACPSQASVKTVPNLVGPWLPVWADTFAGHAGTLPGPAWQYDTGQGIFGNSEIEENTNSPTNVHLDGHGNLDITAVRSGTTWTSARIQTISSAFAAPAGGEMMVSASIMQPSLTGAAAAGYWPAFWLVGPGIWPGTGEMDVLENVDGLSDNAGTLHCGNFVTPNPDGTKGPCNEPSGLSSGLVACSQCLSTYVTYTVIVDRRQAKNEQIHWYIHGKLYSSISESRVGPTVWSAAVDHGFSIILDLAMGGSFPDSVCQCVSPTAQTVSGGTMSVRDVEVEYRMPIA